jgi:hypothetical protein
MKLREAFLVPLLISGGIALPWFVIAQSAGPSASAGTESAEATAERVDSLLTQLGADTPAIRDAAADKLAAEGEAALPPLKSRLTRAKDDGDTDLETRLRAVIERIEKLTEKLADKVEGETQKLRTFRRVEKDADGQYKTDKDGNGSTYRIVLDGGNAARTSVFVENGKTTKIEQSKDGKITLSVTDENGAASTETFDNEEAFKEKHPDLAKKFGESTGVRIFRGPFGEPSWPSVPGFPSDPFSRRVRVVDTTEMSKQVEELKSLLEVAKAQNADALKLIPEGATAEDLAKNADKIRKGLEDNERTLKSALEAAQKALGASGARPVERAERQDDAERRERAEAERQAQQAEDPVQRMFREMEEMQRQMQKRAEEMQRENAERFRKVQENLRKREQERRNAPGNGSGNGDQPGEGGADRPAKRNSEQGGGESAPKKASGRAPDGTESEY